MGETWPVEIGKIYPIEHIPPDLSKPRPNPGLEFFGLTAAGACEAHGVYVGSTCSVCASEREG